MTKWIAAALVLVAGYYLSVNSIIRTPVIQDTYAVWVVVVFNDPTTAWAWKVKP